MTQAQRLRDVQEAWAQFVKSLPDGLQADQASDPISSSVPEWIFDCINNLDVAESSVVGTNTVMKELVWPLVVSQVDQVEATMRQADQQGSAWFLANGRPRMVLGFLWELKKLLAWVIPAIEDPSRYPAVGEVIANAQVVHDLARKAQRATDALANTETAANEIENEVQEALARIQGHEREAGNAQSNASASAASVAQSRQSVEELVLQLNEDVTTQKNLIEHFEKNRDLVEQTLQGASKIGLAKSFSARRENLEKSQKRWSWIFIGGLIALFLGASLPLWIGTVSTGGGAIFELAVPAAGKLSSNTTPSALDVAIGYLSHVLLLGPGIWLTWFAARKYGQLSRLAEDYAFKEASALAFVGYRAEMGEDREMLDLLRKTAIENFGSNPVRVLTADEPASPIHDVLARVLKKMSPDKLADVLKEAIKATKD